MRVFVLCPPPSLSGPAVRPRHAPHDAAITAAAIRGAGHEVAVDDAHLRAPSMPDLLGRVSAFGPDAILVAPSDYNRRIDAGTLDAVFAALATGFPAVPLAGFARLHEAAARKLLEAVPAMPAMLFGHPENAVAAWLIDGRAPGFLARDGDALPPAGAFDPPVPAWDLFDPHEYPFSAHQQQQDAVFPLLTSQSCPFPCFYCEVRARPRYEQRSVDAVLAELRTLRERYGCREVFFADPTFGIDKAWTIALCARLQGVVPGLRWACMARTDRVDAELLSAMARAGCWNVLFGVESLNPDALDKATKNLDPATVGPAIAAAKRAGIEVIVSLMIGLPGDDRASFLRTLDRIVEMNPDYAQFFVLQIDEMDAPGGGRFVSDWKGARYDFWGRVYAADGFASLDELDALRRLAFRRFYLRPRYLAGRARKLLRHPEPVAELRRVARGGLLALRLAGGRPA